MEMSRNANFQDRLPPLSFVGTPSHLTRPDWSSQVTIKFGTSVTKPYVTKAKRRLIGSSPHPSHPLCVFLPGWVLIHYLGLLNSLLFVCADFRRKLSCEYAYRLSPQRYPCLEGCCKRGDVRPCPFSRALQEPAKVHVIFKLLPIRYCTRTLTLRHTSISVKLPHLCGNRPISRSYRCLSTERPG
ncbi:hypothetical protein BGW80DRAFT_898468 [Lactifluus volemus]|nr:hypothetical protein BGW80DRAFT_898468 [Lactifluus volemus]